MIGAPKRDFSFEIYPSDLQKLGIPANDVDSIYRLVYTVFINSGIFMNESEDYESGKFNVSNGNYQIIEYFKDGIPVIHAYWYSDSHKLH